MDLIDAVITNNVQITQKLLNEGADPNQLLDESGVTPLHFAAQNNSLNVVPLLVKAGAKVDAETTPDGQTPLDIAQLHGHSMMVKILLAYSDFERGVTH